MEISCYEILTIKKAMGKHHDLIKVDNNVLTLHWWTNKGTHSLTVHDFNGHNDYFFPFIVKVLGETKKFNEKYGDSDRIDSDEYLIMRNSYLGEENNHGNN